MRIRGFFKQGLACSGVAVLAACGGGGSRPTVDPDVPAAPVAEVPRNTTGLRGGATDLLALWVPTSSPTYTALSAIPTTGSADYAGFMFGDLSTGGTTTDSIIGRMSLEVQFGATQTEFRGSATDFVTSDDTPLDGVLSIAGGTLDRNGNPANEATLRAIGVTGTLTGGPEGPLSFGVQLEGDFVGTAYNAIGGEAIGRADTTNGTQDFDGGFIVAR